MVVDFHTHVFAPEIRARRASLAVTDLWFGRLYGDPRARMATAEQLIASMDRAGVDVSVVMGFSWRDADLCRESNEYLRHSITRFPGRLAALAAVQPSDASSAVYEMEQCFSNGFYGLGELMPDGQGFDLEDERTAGQVLQAAERLGALVLTHVSEPVGHEYAGKGRVRPESVYRTAKRYPSLRLVCAHWGGGLPFYELMPEVAVTMANTRYDTAASTLLYQPTIFAVAERLLAPHKVLFGTDYPVLGQRRSLERVRALGLPPAYETALLGQNGRDLLTAVRADCPWADNRGVRDERRANLQRI